MRDKEEIKSIIGVFYYNYYFVGFLIIINYFYNEMLAEVVRHAPPTSGPPCPQHGWHAWQPCLVSWSSGTAHRVATRGVSQLSTGGCPSDCPHGLLAMSSSGIDLGSYPLFCTPLPSSSWFCNSHQPLHSLLNQLHQRP